MFISFYVRSMRFCIGVVKFWCYRQNRWMYRPNQTDLQDAFAQIGVDTVKIIYQENQVWICAQSDDRVHYHAARKLLDEMKKHFACSGFAC